MMSTTEGEPDVEVNYHLEDGEIQDSDLEEGAYIPLERPETFNPPSLIHMQIQDDAHSDEASLEESSGSDSDGERLRRPKRTKLRPSRPESASQPPQNKKKTNNIWCTAIQEEVLTEDMVGCDVTKTRQYGVESYDYTIKYRLDDKYIAKKPFTQENDLKKIERSGNKRKHTERKNVKLRLGKRVNSHQEPKGVQDTRFLPDLIVTSADAVEDVAKDIADKLDEEKKDLVLKIVEVLGASKAIELYQETQRVEEEGGVMIMNGARRRTPGGVYIYLLKRAEDVSRAMVNQIFEGEVKQQQRQKRRTQARQRRQKVQQLKQTLTDSELPALLSRSETMLAHTTEHGSNPPPSPATDARDCSSDTDAHSHTETQPEDPTLNPHPSASPSFITASSVNNHNSRESLKDYDDDDILEVNCSDDMDLF